MHEAGGAEPVRGPVRGAHNGVILARPHGGLGLPPTRADGASYLDIERGLGESSRTIGKWKRRFLEASFERGRPENLGGSEEESRRL